jgi:hypothetical protein
MIYLKVHETENGGRILAMCDKSLIGRVLEEGDVYIDLKNYSDFYVGELIKDEKEIEVKNVSSVNIIGKEAVALAIKNGVIKKDDVRTVEGVPYAQVYILA